MGQIDYLASIFVIDIALKSVVCFGRQHYKESIKDLQVQVVHKHKIHLVAYCLLDTMERYTIYCHDHQSFLCAHQLN